MMTTPDHLPVWFDRSPNTLLIRLQPDRVETALPFLEQVWKRRAPDRPFQYAFAEDNLLRWYAKEQHTQRLFIVFSTLAIGLACLGLFGLTVYTAERKTKEIGIRKVMGASAAHILALLSQEFVWLAVIANALAWPMAYLAMAHWLEDFAYRVDLDVWPFLLAGLISAGIALLTISLHGVRAARANPVEALRYE
jgi:putative ABC transport system permease protein